MSAPVPSGYFESRFTPHTARAEVWRHVAHYLQRWVPSDGDVIELGAGYGEWICSVDAARRVAVDLDPHLDASTVAARDVEVVTRDVRDLSCFADSTFTTVLASNLLEHLDWDGIDRVVSETRRILRPGGRLIVVQPNFRLASRRYFDDFTHRTIFTDQSLRDYLAVRGLPVIHLEARFLPLTMKSRLSWGHRLVPAYLRSPFRPLAGQMLAIGEKTS